jgi:hypothetical protein
MNSAGRKTDSVGRSLPRGTPTVDANGPPGVWAVRSRFSPGV